MSDHLLSIFTDVSAIVWLSLLKGLTFVLVTTVVLYFVLHKVPGQDNSDLSNTGSNSSLSEPLLSFSAAQSRLPRWFFYVFAIAVTAAIQLLRMAIDVSFAERPLLIIFMFPIILSALLGGVGPGLISVVITAFVSAYYIIPPIHHFLMAAPQDQFQWGMLVANGVIVSILSEAMHRSLRMTKTISQHLNAVVSGTSDAVYVKDLKGRYQLFNEGAARLVNRPVEEVLGHDDTSIFTSDVAAKMMALDKAIMEGGKTQTHEESVTTINGNELTVSVTKGPIFDRHGKVTGLFGISRDITERKNAEDLVQRSGIFIKSILESVDEGFVVIGKDYRIISANKAFCDNAGTTIENAIGRYCHEVSHNSTTPCFEAGEQCAVKRTFETGEHFAILHTHYDEHGNPMYIETKSYAMRDTAGNVTSAIEILVDVTEKKKLEDQYRQAQKMEAIGQLAGGVAHDFNNILSAIIGYGHLSLMKLQEDDPVRPYVDQILQASERAAALTQSLLAFSRKQPVKKELIELNTAIGKFEKILHRLLREDIEMSIQYSDEQPVIMADRGQVEQVIMNLVTNARDAMPDKGKLAIDTRVVAIDEAFIRFHGYGTAGDYAVITVTDSGIGMNKETQKKIFEPFFTTKEMGKGTGLGLATAYGIVKAHDGFINVYSESGKGTAFHVYFPLVRPTESALEPSSLPPVLLKGGTETILLAEDDATLRIMTSIVLRGMGYTVIEAEDGNKAVALFIENRATIKLVILDGIMPKMNGMEAYREINALSPNIRCIFMSGYAGEVFALNNLPTGSEFLPKPVKPSELLNKIREMLDRE